MLFRSMTVIVTALVLIMAGHGMQAQMLTTPGLAEPAFASVPDLAHPAPTRLASLPTSRLYLPIVLAFKLTTPVPSATPQASVVPPTPTANPTLAPGANQLVNPCFDGQHNDDPPGWQQTNGWDVSFNKNPCGPNGTAGRINDPEQAGESGPDRDERIWQVVSGHGPYLVAEMQCVHHYAYYTDMNIYGGSSSQGPWELVWTPFTVADCEQDEWGKTVQHAETRLAQSYAYYKVEFAAMYAPVGPTNGGVKFTKAFFSSRK